MRDLHNDLRSVYFIVSESGQWVTVKSYSGDMSLTNLMPHLARYINHRDRLDVLYIRYIDSEGADTVYNVKMDHYSPYHK